MFRMYFIVFVAPNHHDVDYVYTSKTITLPLLILAIGAVGAGFLNLPSIFGGNHFVDTWLGQLNSKVIHLDHSTEYILMILSVVVAACGIFVAYKNMLTLIYQKKKLKLVLLVENFMLMNFMTSYLLNQQKLFQRL